MSRFNFCDCPAGFEADPERHAPDCPGRSGVGKAPTPVPAAHKAPIAPVFEPNYSRMFLAAVECLAAIDKALGISEATHIVGGAGPALSEIQNLKVQKQRATAERDTLQLRLNAADQRIDELVSAVRSINHGKRHEVFVPGDDEPQYRQRKKWVDWVLSLCDEASTAQPEQHQPEPIDDWRMNPCKQGHRDVGAAGGVAHCYQCDEKIEAATTQEAFERCNATDPQQ